MLNFCLSTLLALAMGYGYRLMVRLDRWLDSFATGGSDEPDPEEQ